MALLSSMFVMVVAGSTTQPKSFVASTVALPLQGQTVATTIMPTVLPPSFCRFCLQVYAQINVRVLGALHQASSTPSH